ncbi:MAG: hypothetical protein ABI758_06800 [Candidatus Woesebacteria bacterium]
MTNYERGDVLILKRNTFSARRKGETEGIYLPKGSRVIVQEINGFSIIFSVNKKAESAIYYRGAKEEEIIQISWTMNQDLFRMATETEKRD